ncbi:MAG: DNA polymerase III subunit delta' [Schwartzia sp.]|nr:DNA polymerase III subunit delta' [Schwartzia sp. (in: firmicutes)]
MAAVKGAEEPGTAGALAIPSDVWASVEGHEERLRRLTQLLAENRLPHALLFYGPEGVGKKRAAMATAATLLCASPAEGRPCGVCESCRALAAGAHPDFILAVPEKTGKATRSIKIEAVRALRAETARRPKLASRLVAVIDDAETMNTAAANALLKTLEEPAGDAVFILVTGAKQALLPTIVSRCMTMAFGTLPDEALSRVLERNGVPGREAAALLPIADGSAGRALRLYAEDALALREDAMAVMESLSRLTPEEIFAHGKRLGALERERLSEWLRHFRLLLRDLMALFGGSPALLNIDLAERLSTLARSFPAEAATLAEREAAETVRRLSGSNVTPRLLVEAFLFRVARGEYDRK